MCITLLRTTWTQEMFCFLLLNPVASQLQSPLTRRGMSRVCFTAWGCAGVPGVDPSRGFQEAALSLNFLVPAGCQCPTSRVHFKGKIFDLRLGREGCTRPSVDISICLPIQLEARPPWSLGTELVLWPPTACKPLPFSRGQGTPFSAFHPSSFPRRAA